MASSGYIRPYVYSPDLQNGLVIGTTFFFVMRQKFSGKVEKNMTLAK